MNNNEHEIINNTMSEAYHVVIKYVRFLCTHCGNEWGSYINAPNKSKNIIYNKDLVCEKCKRKLQ